MIKAKVIKGQQLGRELGFPTLNLQYEDKICWPHGVYACSVLINEENYSIVRNCSFCCFMRFEKQFKKTARE